MGNTDPIADMLTRIRNANMARKSRIEIPASKLKVRLAEILEREGYIEKHYLEKSKVGPGSTLVIFLKYSSGKRGALGGLKRISKPGLRIYVSADRVPRVLGGLGIAVLSTSSGLMTDREARRRHIGGEVLCHIW